MKSISFFRLICLQVLWSICFDASAQTDNFWGKPTLELGLKARPKRNFKDNDSSYSASDFSLKISVPVWKKLSRKENDRFRFSRLIASTSHTFTVGKLSFLENCLTQLRSNLVVTGFTTTGPKNTWLFSLAANALTDTRRLSEILFRPTGVVLYARKATDRFSYRLGLGYSFLFGQGVPLPIVGFSIKSGENGRFSITIPYRISYSIRHSRYFLSQFFLRPEGNIGLIYSSFGDSLNQSQALFLRNRAFSLGYLGVKNLENWGKISFGGGFLVRRKLSLTPSDYQPIESPKTYFSGNLKAGFFVEIRWRIPIGGRKNDESEIHDSLQFLDYLDVNQLDLNDQDL